MNLGSRQKDIQKFISIIAEVIFPLLLLLFPLIKINQGVDLTDTPYSLGNYRFFSQMEGVWVLSTFLSNVAGCLLTRLPMGGSMFFMKLYTSLFVSVMALFAYRFFKTKMPSWLAFVAELSAIGFCWCPTGILYNYMTYLFFLMGAVFLFRGLAGGRPLWLFAAGVCLGLNVSVRIPNVLETSLIIALWYYGARKKKTFEQIIKETGICAGGFLTACVLMFCVICVYYGIGAYGEMIGGLFGMAQGASDYTLGEMLRAIMSAYIKGFRWMLYMIFCILPGIPFFVIQKEKFPLLRKIIYCMGIVFLFFVLGRWGMYNFKYYQKEAGLQWGVVFLLLSLSVCVWMLFTRMLDDEWKLIGCISLIIILITPLGSNNHVWPALNNLFFVAPVTFWMIYRFAIWGRMYLDSTGKVPLFPVKSMAFGVMLVFLVQSLGLGFCYVFIDGENGEPRNIRVIDNPVASGMYTSALNAETLDEISLFMLENQTAYREKGLILYGNIPGLSYYLDKPSAIFTTWPDLDTNSFDRLSADLGTITEALHQEEKAESDDGERPLVILSAALHIDGEEEAQDRKLQAILTFMEENEYEPVFENEAYIVYE